MEILIISVAAFAGISSCISAIILVKEAKKFNKKIKKYESEVTIIDSKTGFKSTGYPVDFIGECPDDCGGRH